MRNLFYLYLLILPAAGAAGYLMRDIWVMAAILAVVSMAMYAIHTAVVRQTERRAKDEAAGEFREYMEIKRAAKPSSHAEPPAGIQPPRAG